MPDEKLMQHLERKRDRGRDDYPLRAMWNSILAGVIYQHPSIESLIIELSRNSQLRRTCGFAEDKVLPSWAYSRFLANLFKHKQLINEIFLSLVEQCYKLLPGFGRHLALDGKAINSLARRENKIKKADRRRDLVADTRVKSYKGHREDGTLWEKVTYWFGYELHLLFDTDYELSVAFELTPASHSEVKQAHRLIGSLDADRPEVLEACEYFTADRGYNDGKLNSSLFDDHGIKPVIDTRNLWRDCEKTRFFDGRDNIVYDYRDTVYCCCPKELKFKEIDYGGFEKGRDTLKYCCPAEHYGLKCKGKDNCPVTGSIRISIFEDRCIFTPLPRFSYKWQNLYKKRTTAERVNSRLNVYFGFEHHFIRGLEKMHFRCSLALCIMLAMAVGRGKKKLPYLLSSLVKSA